MLIAAQLSHDRSPLMSRPWRDALVAGLVAGSVSGLPSTTWAVLRGHDALAATKAAGALVLRRETRTAPLLLAAVPVHLAVSTAWAGVLAVALPRGRELLWGAAAGLAIAALDLGLVGRRIPQVRALPQPPQWVDHATFGLVVGIVLARRRAR